MAVPDTEREREVFGSLAKHFVRGGVEDERNIPEKITKVDIPIPELALDFPKMSFSTKYSRVADVAEMGELQVERQEDRFVITIPGESLFDSGEAQIKAQFLPLLARIANKAMEHNLSITIEGHTDDRPISTPRFPSNWELSVARAVSVLRYFLDLGIPTDHLAAAGRGRWAPIASNDSAEGRAKNRRVTLIIKERAADE